MTKHNEYAVLLNDRDDIHLYPDFNREYVSGAGLCNQLYIFVNNILRAYEMNSTYDNFILVIDSFLLCIFRGRVACFSNIINYDILTEKLRAEFPKKSRIQFRDRRKEEDDLLFKHTQFWITMQNVRNPYFNAILKCVIESVQVEILNLLQRNVIDIYNHNEEDKINCIMHYKMGIDAVLHYSRCMYVSVEETTCLFQAAFSAALQVIGNKRKILILTGTEDYREIFQGYNYVFPSLEEKKQALEEKNLYGREMCALLDILYCYYYIDNDVDIIACYNKLKNSGSTLSYVLLSQIKHKNEICLDLEKLHI